MSGWYLFVAFLGMGISQSGLVPGLDHRLTSSFCVFGVVPWGSDALPRKQRRQRCRSEQYPKASGTSNAKPAVEAGKPRRVSERKRERKLLERIRKLKAPRWRSFGPCRYDWSAWRLKRRSGAFPRRWNVAHPPVAGQRAQFHCAQPEAEPQDGH